METSNSQSTPGMGMPHKKRLHTHIPKKISIMIGGAIILLLLAGGAAYLVLKSKTPNQESPPDPKTVAKSLIEQSQKNQQSTTTSPSKEQVSQSKQQQFDAVKKQIAEQEKSGSTPTADQGVVYMQAAFLAAEKNDPQAKSYAQKALDTMPKDQATQTYYKGYIYALTKIAAGDYSVVPH